jgi:hypothetical protein
MPRPVAIVDGKAASSVAFAVLFGFLKRCNLRTAADRAAWSP